jgi:hypothetical protein
LPSFFKNIIFLFKKIQRSNEFCVCLMQHSVEFCGIKYMKIILEKNTV